METIMNKTIHLAIAVAVTGFQLTARAKSPVGERDGWPGDTRADIPYVAVPPVIDGKIGVEEWKDAATFDAQISQNESRVFLARPVTWYLAWDADHLYVACRSPLLEKGERVKRVARQPVGSTVMMDDSMEVWLDPRGRNEGEELASYFQAVINALGITYFKQTYPKIGAINNTWKPDWKIASQVAPDYSEVTWEVAIPRESLHLAEPNRAGDTWGLMLARNFMYRTWNQSALAWQFPGFGFSVNSSYPLFTLTESAPFVRAENPLPIMQGRAFAAFDLVNPGTKTAELSVNFRILDKVGKSLFEKEAKVSVQPGDRQPFRVDEVLSPPIDPALPATYRYDLTVASLADGREIFHTHFAFDPTKGRLRTGGLPPPKEFSTTTQLNPTVGLLETQVDVIDSPRRADVVAARLALSDSSGKKVADQRSDRRFADMFNFTAAVPGLAPGKYRWETFVEFADGTTEAAGEGEVEKLDEATAFPWWQTKIGDAEKVLAPYTPLSVEKEGQTLRAWGKEYQLDGLALPKQILVNGNADRWPAGRTGPSAIMAAPVTVSAVLDGQPASVKPASSPELIRVSPHRVELAGSATAGNLAVSSRTKLEQDGAYFVDLTVSPAKPGASVQVDQLTLSIPVKNEVARYLNAFGVTGHGGGYVMKLVPEQSGKVWDSRDNGSKLMTAGYFIPQVWLGSEYRGLLWYADNDQGWTPSDERVPQEVIRSGDRTSMVFRLIDTPTKITDPRTIRFVLQPTPIRPLQPGWRMLNVDFAQSFLNWDAMGRSRAAYSASINLANDAAYAKSKAFASAWPGPKAAQPNLAKYFAPHTESSAIMTTDRPARKYFGGEWEDGSYVDSLNDHTLWWLNKWAEQGGVQGIYHDQFAPHVISSIASGLAYLLPDGRVQPGYALTTRRRYVMREHALWLENGIAEPRTLTHTTNGGPMGSFGWVESCVDGEAKLINSSMDIDFADTWPSERLRAGSLSFSSGVTYGWMRLIDERGMTKEQAAHHQRVYAGHCLMHDNMNAWVWSYASNNAPDSPLLRWGMNDDRVFFWPFWSNTDVIGGQTETLKVSAWTLPDRILLAVFNYDKKAPANAAIHLDLAKLGVKLPPDAVITDLEKPDAAVGGNAAKGDVTAEVGPRDYRLISISGKSTE